MFAVRGLWKHGDSTSENRTSGPFFARAHLAHALLGIEDSHDVLVVVDQGAIHHFGGIAE